jgi:hypothetical protein
MEKHIHLKPSELTTINIKKEENNSVTIIDKKGNHIHFFFNSHDGIVIEKNLTTNIVISKFVVFLSFEKEQIKQLDILRSAIKTYYLMKNHNFTDHFFIYNKI